VKLLYLTTERRNKVLDY